MFCFLTGTNVDEPTTVHERVALALQTYCPCMIFCHDSFSLLLILEYVATRDDETMIPKGKDSLTILRQRTELVGELIT